eukprot:4084014-Alexandrium_andersonii.AAC.1
MARSRCSALHMRGALPPLAGGIPLQTRSWSTRVRCSGSKAGCHVESPCGQFTTSVCKCLW